MADYDQNGNPADMSGQIDGARTWCHLIYALHGISALGGVLGGASIILSFLFGWPSIIAVILNYVTRDNARGTWLDSHWRWQLRTFWLTAAWTLAAALLFLTLIGIPLALLIVAVISLWLLYRVIRGWLALADRRPMPVPD